MAIKEKSSLRLDLQQVCEGIGQSWSRLAKITACTDFLVSLHGVWLTRLKLSMTCTANKIMYCVRPRTCQLFAWIQISENNLIMHIARVHCIALPHTIHTTGSCVVLLHVCRLLSGGILGSAMHHDSAQSQGPGHRRQGNSHSWGQACVTNQWHYFEIFCVCVVTSFTCVLMHAYLSPTYMAS